jgi:3-oxoacyl-[acyl-carrier protein] reductase
VDLADESATHQTFIKINETYDVSGIVKNVGIAIREPISEITLSNLYTVLDLNLRPALNAMQVFMNGKTTRISNA